MHQKEVNHIHQQWLGPAFLRYVIVDDILRKRVTVVLFWSSGFDELGLISYIYLEYFHLCWTIWLRLSLFRIREYLSGSCVLIFLSIPWQCLQLGSFLSRCNWIKFSFPTMGLELMFPASSGLHFIHQLNPQRSFFFWSWQDLFISHMPPLPGLQGNLLIKTTELPVGDCMLTTKIWESNKK